MTRPPPTSILLALGAVALVFASSAARAQSQLSTVSQKDLSAAIAQYPAQEGIAYGDGAFYTAEGTCLEAGVGMAKWSENWALISDAFSLDTGPCDLCHIGDVGAGGGFAYAIVTDFVPVPLTVPNYACLLRYDPGLNYVSYADRSELISTFGFEDLAGIAYYEGFIYVVSYEVDAGSPAQIFKFTSDLQIMLNVFEISTLHANGIAIRNGVVYVSAGDDPNVGQIDLYDLNGLAPLGRTVNGPFESDTFTISHGQLVGTHAEGITFRGAELWTAQFGFAVQVETPGIGAVNEAISRAFTVSRNTVDLHEAISRSFTVSRNTIDYSEAISRSFTLKYDPNAALCSGDIDGDGDTDVFDFAIFAVNFTRQDVPPFTLGDLDGDGDVDVFDFAIFAGDFTCGL